MATVKYTYLIIDFLNDICFAGGLGQEIEASSITTALSYINTSPNVCDIYFESTLTGPEVTTLDGLVAAHDGVEPIVPPGLVLSPDGSGSFDWDNITVISGAVHYLDMMEFIENIYGDLTTLSGVVDAVEETFTTISGAMETAIANITTFSGAVQTSLDEVYETITVTSGTLQDQIDNVSASGTGIDSKVFDFAVRDASKEYFEVNVTNFMVTISFPFPGTDSASTSLFEIVASRIGTAGTGEIQLYDYTNNNVIATIVVTAEEKAVYSTASLQNLPPAPSLFEVLVRKSPNQQAGKIRIHSCVIR
jgi:hypothetical protein